MLAGRTSVASQSDQELNSYACGDGDSDNASDRTTIPAPVWSVLLNALRGPTSRGRSPVDAVASPSLLYAVTELKLISSMIEFYHNHNFNNNNYKTMVQDNDNIQSTPVFNTRQDSVKCEKTIEVCEGCGQKIHDRFLMRVADASWHEHCLACTECGVLLSHSCYCRNSKLYCKADYDRKFGVKCGRCGDRLLPHELVMRAQSYVFHLQCFVCVVCCQPLQKGEQFVLRTGQLFCRHDFEKEMYMMTQANSPGDDMLDENSRPRDGRRGPKRPRTILTSAQRRQFKASFEVSPKPCRKVREALAKETGLSVRVVQVWFQNQRAKMKKLQRKAKQEADQKSSSSDKDKDSKEDKAIKQEPSSNDHNHYLRLNGLSLRDPGDPNYNPSSSSQPLNPNMPYSPDDTYPNHSGDSFCSSDISLDGSANFDHMDEGGSDTLSLQNLDMAPHAPPPDTLIPGAIQVNPIDKLYLMQNSYFNTEH